MKIGVIYPQNEFGGDPEAVERLGLAVEELGFDHLLTYDHVLGAAQDRERKLWGPYTEMDPFHDPFVMFSYLAAITRRIEFVTGILVLPQRQTALVARQAADLDLLSRERFTLGVGIGWNYVEYEALGENFKTRGRRMDEQIKLLRRLWSEPLIEFEGSFHRIDRAALNPRPRRRIPIVLGGFAEAALRRAALLGDGFIFADGATDAFVDIQRLRELLKETGRAEDGFTMHCAMLRADTPQEVVETVRRWKDAGGTHASVYTMGKDLTTVGDHIAYLTKVAEALRSAGV